MSRKILFIKPDLDHFFARMLPYSIPIRQKYHRARTKEQLADLFHNWMDIAERTNVAEAKVAYRASAYYIYALIAKKSYESILNIEE